MSLEEKSPTQFGLGHLGSQVTPQRKSPEAGVGGCRGWDETCLLKATRRNLWVLTGSIIWGGRGILGDGGGAGGCGSQVVGLSP